MITETEHTHRVMWLWKDRKEAIRGLSRKRVSQTILTLTILLADSTDGRIITLKIYQDSPKARGGVQFRICVWCLRNIVKILKYEKGIVMMLTVDKKTPMQRTVILNQCSLENQKYIETGKRRTNTSDINLITRLTVTIEGYRRCKASARYRSKLIAVMADIDTKARETPNGYPMAPEMQYTGKFVVKEQM
ncbi:hypothetical protein ACROYT_G043413 [Oculina patagonica]